MARIPQYVSRETLDTGRGSMVRVPADLGIARGLQELGNSLSALAASTSAGRQNAELAKTIADARVNWTVKQSEIIQNAPESGEGTFQSIRTGYEAFTNDIVGRANPAIRDQLAARLATIGVGFAVDAHTFETKALATKESKDLADVLNQNLNIIYSNPERYDGSLTEAQEVIAGSSLPEETKRTMLDAFKLNAQVARVNRLIRDGRGEEALAEIRGGAGPTLLRAQIQQESGGNPRAVSPKGAVGLMQIMPGTAREIAKDLGNAQVAAMDDAQITEALKNPELNVRYGTYYLNKMLRRYGHNIALALAAYNAGPATVDGWLDVIGDPRRPGSGSVDKETIAFFTSRAASEFVDARRVAKMDPEFASRLEAAIKAAEKATGAKAEITDTFRSVERQKQYHDASRSGQGGLAAAPGRSRHQPGAAADIKRGPVLDWLHENAGEFGLRFLRGDAFAKDPVHIQMDGSTATMEEKAATARFVNRIPVKETREYVQNVLQQSGLGSSGEGFQSDRVADIPFDVRNRLEAQAVNAIEQQQTADLQAFDHANTLAEKSIKAQTEQQLTDFYDRADPNRAGGRDVTREDAEALKGRVPPATYRSLLKAVDPESEDVPDDRDQLAFVHQLYDAGQFEDAKNVLYRAHGQGQIKNSTFRALHSKISTEQGSGGPPTGYRMARDLLKNSLEPGFGVDNPAGRRNTAEALTQFDRFAKDTPNATDEEYEAEARKLIDRWLFLDFSQTAATLPIPLGADGNTLRKANDADTLERYLEDLTRTLTNLQIDGTITPERLLEEARIVERWEAIVPQLRIRQQNREKRK